MNNIIKERIFALHGFDFAGNITKKEGCKGVYVKYDGKDAVIGFETKAQEARCYFHLGSKIKKGLKSFEIEETPAFEECGMLLDVSRGGVIGVDGIKEYLTYMASLGMNQAMLYTEDLFDLENYPIFGYMRGRYSMAELKEIDDFAYEMGIEMIPCVETLGHLEQFIRWGTCTIDSMGITFANTDSVLLVGDDETYKFIEDIIKYMREAFRSDTIYLNLDETYGMETGRYEKIHGHTDATEVYLYHLNRVWDITKKYYKTGIIASDMLFPSESGRVFDPDTKASKAVQERVPKDIDVFFWDYYNYEYEFYDQNIKNHLELKNKTRFLGAVWTWDGFAPHFDWTMRTMIPALKACVDNGITSVCAAKFGEDAMECDYIKAVPGLCVFSEYCYKGKACTQDDIYEMMEEIGHGLNRELADAISEYYLGLRGSARIGKGIFYADPLYNLLHFDIDYDDAVARFKKSLEIVKKNSGYEFSDYYAKLFEITILKTEVLGKLRPAYKSGDKAYLKKAAEEIFPQLITLYNEFYEMFKTEWKKRIKPNGFEANTMHFGGVMLRLKDASEIINDYLDGKIEKIEEMEEGIIPHINKRWRKATDYMTTFRPFL